MFGLLSRTGPVCDSFKASRTSHWGTDVQNSVGSFRGANVVPPSRPGDTVYGSLFTRRSADAGELHSKQHLHLFGELTNPVEQALTIEDAAEWWRFVRFPAVGRRETAWQRRPAQSHQA